jgi:hypothetical protein
MKKALSIILIALFAVSCGGSGEPSIDTNVSGTDGSVDTLQPILDSAAHVLDSIQAAEDSAYAADHPSQYKGSIKL